MIPYSVVALLWNEGRLLAVSRKDNHEDLGLPGGKIDPGETPEKAIHREVLEETGLRLTGLEHVFDHLDRVEGDERRPARCFKATWEGTIQSGETGWVGWVEPIRLLSETSTFREYNRALFLHLGLPTLIWYQRADGAWNADCACGAFLCGFSAHLDEQVVIEAQHFRNAERDRELLRRTVPDRVYPPCGLRQPDVVDIVKAP